MIWSCFWRFCKNLGNLNKNEHHFVKCILYYLSFAPVAVIFKIHGQILYTLIYTYNDIYMVYTSVQCNVYLFPIVHICLTFKPKFERLVTKIFKLINLTYTYILWYFKFRKEAKVLWYQELRLAGGRILSPSTFKPRGSCIMAADYLTIAAHLLK